MEAVAPTRRAVIISLYLALAGCTHTFHMPVTLVELPKSDQIDLRVELRIPEDLRGAKAKVTYTPDTDVLPLGATLSANVERVARAIFTEVELRPKTRVAESQQIDAILKTDLLTIARDRPMFAYEEQTTLLVLQWTLIDTKGNVIWTETMRGEGTGPVAFGLSRERAAQAQARAAVEELFRESYDAMSSSIEIGQFARDRKRAPHEPR